MRVLNVCVDDWANFSYDNCKALQSIGINAHSCKLNKHIFNYSYESEIISLEEMREEIKKADIINYVHNNISLFNSTFDLLKNKKLIVTYTGSSYRNNPIQHNNIFNPHISVSLTDQCEFMGLGAKNINYIATAIDIKNYPKPDFKLNLPIKFGHFPSNPDIKGTKEIIHMMGLSKTKLWYSLEKISHADQLERMRDCDVYIELFKPELNGKPYGCYGVTAFEAAALGKIVITNNIHSEVYEKAYGWSPFLIANTEKEFLETINQVNDMVYDELRFMQTNSYNWIKQNHSYEATGNYLKNILWKI